MWPFHSQVGDLSAAVQGMHGLERTRSDAGGDDTSLYTGVDTSTAVECKRSVSDSALSRHLATTLLKLSVGTSHEPSADRTQKL